MSRRTTREIVRILIVACLSLSSLPLGAWADSLVLQDATFFGQDWGSLIGLTVVLQREARFRAITVGNAALPDPRNFMRIVEAR